MMLVEAASECPSLVALELVGNDIKEDMLIEYMQRRWQKCGKEPCNLRLTSISRRSAACQPSRNSWAHEPQQQAWQQHRKKAKSYDALDRQPSQKRHLARSTSSFWRQNTTVRPENEE